MTIYKITMPATFYSEGRTRKAALNFVFVFRRAAMRLVRGYRRSARNFATRNLKRRKALRRD